MMVVKSCVSVEERASVGASFSNSTVIREEQVKREGDRVIEYRGAS
jgi:hypothetical protein